MPSFEYSEMYFFCDFCNSCIYGIEKVKEHQSLCVEPIDTEAEMTRESVSYSII